jgi:hypothetical protein
MWTSSGAASMKTKIRNDAAGKTVVGAVARQSGGREKTAGAHQGVKYGSAIKFAPATL